MLVSEIYDEVSELLGITNQTVIFQRLTRAIQLLSNSGLFDPLVASVDFYVNGSFFVALPRDVKTPLRININHNPAFARSRLFEYTPNTNGSSDGPEIGWQWFEKGYSPIQNQTLLPSQVYYVVNSADVGSTLIIGGLDQDGIYQTETLTGATGNTSPSINTYKEITSVSRVATTEPAFLAALTGNLARYAADETCPEYRVIKLSQTGVAVRMLYRKHVFQIKALTDIIPLQSEMAVIRATEAVALMQRPGRDNDAANCMASAVQMIGAEQESRNEDGNMSQSLEVQTATNQNINCNDVLIVGDIFDDAAKIAGPVGTPKVFDRITDAIDVLQNKTQWDSQIGDCSIWISTIFDPTSYRKPQWVYVLPRFVQSVLVLNYNSRPTIPRNRWFEYHLNGTGDSDHSSHGTWDDAGDTCIINALPITKPTPPAGGQFTVIPTQVIAVPDNPLDNGSLVTIYGQEQLADGSEIEVWRNGVRGWNCPCQTLPYPQPVNAPNFTRIDRITRVSTIGFVHLYGMPSDNPTNQILLGYWYPDEVEPTYRMIRVQTSYGQQPNRIQIRYRKRSKKISSMFDVINLRSRTGLLDMMRSLAAKTSDVQAAAMYEGMAVKYLEEEMAATNPIQAGGLQFDPGTSPGFAGNIS